MNMCKPSIEDIRIVFEILLSPETGSTNFSEDPSNLSLTIWKKLYSNIIAVEEKSSQSNFKWLRDVITFDKSTEEFNVSETRWNYSCICLRLLLVLKDKLADKSIYSHHSVNAGVDAKFEANLSPPCDLLSIQFHNLINRALQFVVCLGIASNLLPGVGISLERKSSFYKLIALKSDEDESVLKKQENLFWCTKTLLQCMQNYFLSNLIATQYLCDILAALLQLSYLPLKYVQNTGNMEISHICISAWRGQQIECRKYLDELINKHCQTSMVREFFVLQGIKSRKGLNQISAKYIPSPPWLRIACTKIITRILMKSNGVISVISGILDIHISEDKFEKKNSNVIDWHKCEVVAKLIGICPPYVQSREDYYYEIIPQVMHLLHLKYDWNKKLAGLINGIISTISLESPDIAKNKIFIPLMKPLQKCNHINSYDPEAVMVVDESSLTQCIQDLYLIFIIGGQPGSSLIQHIVSVWNILFHVYSFAINTPSFLKSQVRELLIHSLQSFEELYSVNLLNGILNNENFPEESLLWNNNLKVTMGSSGGLEIRFEENSNQFDQDFWKIEAIIDLLTSVKKKNLMLEFFLNLHEHLPAILDDEKMVKQTSPNSSQLLLEIEAASERRVCHIRQSLIVCDLLKRLSENNDLFESLVENHLRAILFVKSTLKRGAEMCTKTCDLDMDVESLNFAMSFLGIIVTQEMKLDVINELKQIEPSLFILSSEHSNEFVREMAKELRITILTHGIVKSDKYTMQEQKNISTEKNLNSKNHSDKQEKETKDDKVNRSSFQQAWFELNDPSPPVRGHALLTIRKLLENKDLETLQNKDKILNGFKENLKHKDSYVYLNAIQGLAVIADKYPDDVISKLTQEFMKTENSLEIRMKIGEALVKTVRYLGDMLPKHATILLDTFLRGCKENDSLLRASSLSNLGEICKGLQFSLGPIVHEIFNCVSSILKSDDAVEVRQAAALVLTMLLQGLGKNSLQVLDTVLKDLYRLLRHIHRCEKEDIVKLHVQLALEELDNLMHEFLFPKESLVKKITILDPI